MKRRARERNRSERISAWRVRRVKSECIEWTHIYHASNVTSLFAFFAKTRESGAGMKLRGRIAAMVVNAPARLHIKAVPASIAQIFELGRNT